MPNIHHYHLVIIHTNTFILIQKIQVLVLMVLKKLMFLLMDLDLLKNFHFVIQILKDMVFVIMFGGIMIEMVFKILVKTVLKEFMFLLHYVVQLEILIVILLHMQLLIQMVIIILVILLKNVIMFMLKNGKNHQKLLVQMVKNMML